MVKTTRNTSSLRPSKSDLNSLPSHAQPTLANHSLALSLSNFRENVPLQSSLVLSCPIHILPETVSLSIIICVAKPALVILAHVQIILPNNKSTNLNHDVNNPIKVVIPTPLLLRGKEPATNPPFMKNQTHIAPSQRTYETG